MMRVRAIAFAVVLRMATEVCGNCGAIKRVGYACRNCGGK